MLLNGTQRANRALCPSRGTLIGRGANRSQCPSVNVTCLRICTGRMLSEDTTDQGGSCLGVPSTRRRGGGEEWSACGCL